MAAEVLPPQPHHQAPTALMPIPTCDRHQKGRWFLQLVAEVLRFVLRIVIPLIYEAMEFCYFKSDQAPALLFEQKVLCVCFFGFVFQKPYVGHVLNYYVPAQLIFLRVLQDHNPSKLFILCFSFCIIWTCASFQICFCEFYRAEILGRGSLCNYGYFGFCIFGLLCVYLLLYDTVVINIIYFGLHTFVVLHFVLLQVKLV